MRSLEKQIGKIARKIAFKAVGVLETETAEATDITQIEKTPEETTSLKKPKDFEVVYHITEDNLEEYLGKPKYPEVGVRKRCLFHLEL